MNLESNEYIHWLKELKNRVRVSQLKASISVNTTLLMFYWELGSEIVEKQKSTTWGKGFIKQLSLDLLKSFPSMKGFSVSNIKYIRQWYLFYNSIGQQAVGQLVKIPWGHNIAIISKCKHYEEALFYVKNTISNSWSRSVLIHQIESDLWCREGRVISNFDEALPKIDSDLAKQTIKDPYIFDFLSLTKEHNERDLENGLIEHITSFLLELGAGFAYMGRQIPLSVGTREFYVDLLFYHTKLHCYVVVELKTGDFEPEHIGKLNFYIKAVDEQYRVDADKSTIGILLCKNRDTLVAEYALSDVKKPIGISEYRLTQSLPTNLKSSLPSIEEIEREFKSTTDLQE